ncbi:MAG: DUF296 domain-containing protein [Candidatus Marinimicrobia bacterium]|nr:DUF296 domain-containing protein [Candidatus Neomarinimicrobiota bacterium]
MRKFIEHAGIKGGTVVGIGALSSYVLGYYDIHKEEYQRKEYSEEVELVSCVGNIAYKGSEPITHLHAVVSNSEMETRGGHLFEGIISATGEFSIIDSDIRIERLNKGTGLPLLDLPNKL